MEMTQPITGVRYHQKRTLIENISWYIHDSLAGSLLDIGAGTTDIAVALSREVEQYTAVEQDSRKVAELKNAGLKVVQGRFPCQLSGVYDLVLSSHSLPESSTELYPAFLSAAWELTSNNGIMLIVTFKGAKGDLAVLRNELLGSEPGSSPELQVVLGQCSERGSTDVRPVNSFVEADTVDDLAYFLGPWLCGQKRGEAFHRQLTHILNRRYKVRDGLFVFPTQHLFIRCRKKTGK